MESTASPTDARKGDTRRLPLEGLRVLDFTIVWAGPMCTQILADLGAEVIKVEATTRLDPERGGVTGRPGRRFPGGEPGDRPFNRGARFHEYNRGKLGITVNLKHPDGPPIVRDLVRVSDIVVENFSAGVMNRLGFGYEDLVKLRPDIILLSMQAFGSTGPESENVGYGPTQEAMSGLSALTGYENGPPMLTGVFYGDPVGGTCSASAALMALWRRRQTGRGAHIDGSQQEMLLSLIPESLLEYQLTNRMLGPEGNRDARFAPQGCYPCAGTDAWIAISVHGDAEWHALRDVLALGGAGEGERFSTHAARRANHDALDELIASRTRECEHIELMRKLQNAGIAAEAVLNLAEVLSDVHLRDRGFFQQVSHPEVGTYDHSSTPWRFDGEYLPIHRPAPCLGEHNEDVLGGLLGLTQDELQRLEAEGVIGTEPRRD